jgi:membrane-bound lytic murein transglycosylase D
MRGFLFLWLACAPAFAWADEGSALRGSLPISDEQRRIIRGAPPPPAEVGDPLLADLERFEREAFAPDAPKVEHDDQVPEEWLRALTLGDFPMKWDARVVKFLKYYKDEPRGRALMTSWLRAQGRYRGLILDALRRHQLPEDLLYLCMIESSYNPNTVSRVGASGLWQFMPAGGRIYGLEQSYWLDERSDPEKATEAAMLYFRDLIERFGNWHIALAAFNAGYGAMLKSMAKYNTNDFWALLDIEAGLPWESSVYVPKALAAAVIGRNRAAFGYDAVPEEPPWEFERITVRKSVELSAIARAAGVDVQSVRELNPELRRGRTPPRVPAYTLRVPKGSRQKVADALPALEGEADLLQEVAIRHGERFEDVARTYGLSPRALRELNGVTDLVEVRGGTVLLVPKLAEDVVAANRRAAEEDLYHSDIVPGESEDALLVAVRDKYMVLPGKKRVFYRVVVGDSLPEVARALGVTEDDLVDWNDLDPEAKIQARMVLQAFVPETFDPSTRGVALLDPARLNLVTMGSPEHLDVYEGRKGRVRVTVTVKPGDTLETIGKKFTLTKYDVARINGRGYTTPLVPGEELVVYRIVDKDKAEKTGVYKNIKGKGKAKKGKGRSSSSAKARASR